MFVNLLHSIMVEDDFVCSKITGQHIEKKPTKQNDVKWAVGRHLLTNLYRFSTSSVMQTCTMFNYICLLDHGGENDHLMSRTTLWFMYFIYVCIHVMRYLDFTSLLFTGFNTKVSHNPTFYINKPFTGVLAALWGWTQVQLRRFELNAKVKC